MTTNEKNEKAEESSITFEDIMKMHREPLRIAVLVSGSGSNLQSLIDNERYFNYRIALVASDNPEAYGLVRAQKAGIPTLVVNRKDYEDKRSFEIDLSRGIHRAKPDLLVLAGFMRVLSEHFVFYFEHRIVNIHPSLLPKHKGLHTHARVLEAGEKRHGATVHYVTAELDGGPLIAFGDLHVRDDDTPETLAKRVLEIEHDMLPKVIGAIAYERINFPPNKIFLDRGIEAPFHYGQMFSL